MGSLRAQFDLLPEPASAGAGRRAVTQVLTDWGISAETVGDAVLVVSELVTNAVLHAPSGHTLSLEVSMSGRVLRVSLSDSSPASPRWRSPSGQDEGGRGIGILDTLSTRWGVAERPGGKALWFEIDLAS